MKHIFIFLILICSKSLFGEIKFLRASYNNDPSTTISIGWTEDDATIYYGTEDKGVNYLEYPNSKSSTSTNTIYQLTNYFANLTGLTPGTTYYFVLRSVSGNVSKRYSFRTLSDNPNVPLNFVSGGDTRDGIIIESCNCRGERQKGFTLLGKICADFIVFSGDFVGGPQQSGVKSFKVQWQEWLTDWQLTFSEETKNRLIPILPALGNHEEPDNNLKFFNVPVATTTNYYGLTFGGDLIRIYSLNSELAANSTSNTTLVNWFKNDLQLNNSVRWKAVQYHKPMVPQGHYSPEPVLINTWAPLFSQYGVRLAMEGHTHIYKVSWPAARTTGSGQNAFIRNDSIGCVFIGEGNMGAPFRSNLYAPFSWTRERDKEFNSFFFIRVTKDTMSVKTVLFTGNESLGYCNSISQGSSLPSNVNIYDNEDGASNDPEVLIPIFGKSDFSNTSTGIKTNKIVEVLQVFPNPASTSLNFRSINPNLNINIIEIYDAFGRHISNISKNELTIPYNISKLSKGTYYIYVHTDEGIQNIRFIKE